MIGRIAANDAYAWSHPDSYVRSYAANGLNQYSGTTSTGASPAAYSYDPNGNLASDGTRFFVYDVENRLVSASGGASAALVYDPLGRLFQTSGGTAGIAQFLYDGDELVSEFNSAGTVLRRYIHGPGSDDPLVWYEGPYDWDRRSLIANHQGSIVGAVSAAGTAAPVNTYDPWGIPGSDNNGRFGYTGQVWIPERGLWYYKARFYSPTTGRFMQVDPIGYDDQMNLYGYVGNDPVNKSDPTGTSEEFSCAKIGTGCGPQNGNSAIENGLRGAASLPRDLFIEVRHAIRLTGLTGREAQNRALLVDALGARALGHIKNHLGETARQVVDWGLSNKAFLAGRAGTGALVTVAGGGALGAAVTVAAGTGGGVRALSNVVDQLENGGIDARSFSNKSLGSIMAAGILGAGVRFDARSGNVNVRTNETGSLAPRTSTICNVRKDC